MTQTLDTVTSQTKLNREESDVIKELADKRESHRKKMEEVRKMEEEVKVKRAQLREKLVDHYKVIQDQELQRSRATKRVVQNEAQKASQQEDMNRNNIRVNELQLKKQEAKDMCNKYQVYETYLISVMTSPETTSEYHEVKDIIERYSLLERNQAMLINRTQQLSDSLTKNRAQALAKEQKRRTETYESQQEMQEQQVELERLAHLIQQRQDELEGKIKTKCKDTLEIGQIEMACNNLYDRCIEKFPIYKPRGQANDKEGLSVVMKLSVIKNHLEDMNQLIAEEDRNQRAKDLLNNGGQATVLTPTKPSVPTDMNKTQPGMSKTAKGATK